MLKRLFKQLFLLIFQPTTAWKVLADEREEEITNNNSFLETYLYPIIGIAAILAFIGVFFHKKEFDVQLALRLTIKIIIALFAGFYLAALLLPKAMEHFLSIKSNDKLCQRFIGYSSALVYLTYMVLAIFPEFSFLSLFMLYTVYMIWEGAMPYMQIPENKRSKFTAIASVIILLSPFIIKQIMSLTMPGMRI